MRVGGPAGQGSVKACEPCASAPFGAAGHRSRGPASPAPSALDRRTKNLTKRLRPGDIAVIDHVDIDRVSADALVELQGRRRRQRRAQHLRPLPQPRPGDPDQRRHPAAGRRRARRCSPALKEGAQVRLDGNQLLAEDGTVVAEGVGARPAHRWPWR